MHCPYCQQEHPKGAIFCPITGEPIPQKNNTFTIIVLTLGLCFILIAFLFFGELLNTSLLDLKSWNISNLLDTTGESLGFLLPGEVQVAEIGDTTKTLVPFQATRAAQVGNFPSGISATSLPGHSLTASPTVYRSSTPYPQSALTLSLPKPRSTTETAPSPNDSHQTNGNTSNRQIDNMIQVHIPAGEFLMGTSYGEEDEKPEHLVYLDDFWIDQCETTNARYADFLNANGEWQQGVVTWLDFNAENVWLYQTQGKWSAVSGYENHPVVEVTWHGAQAYCEWANARLPTEAEWEKAARGTDGRIYPWGNQTPNISLVNFYSSSSLPIGSYPEGSSPYGILDMAGNVWEYVSDWYGEDYYSNSTYQNPTGMQSGDFRVIRGGSFNNSESRLRTANRGHIAPYLSDDNLGFRCVRLDYP